MELGPHLVTEICSAFSEEHKVVCDLPRKHRGPHKATVLFGDEEGLRDDD